MQAIIFTDNIRQAEFVQKGLRYESLSSDIFTFQGINNIDFFVKRLPYYDGVFLLFNSLESSVLLEISKIIKDYNPKMPVILLRSNSEDIDELSNHQYVACVHVRPFAFRNISSDMKYEIFNSREFMNSKYVVRDLELDLDRHQVCVKGTNVNLRNKEFALLHYMMLNPGKVMSRTSILENVWDRNANILTNTVDVHISKLRSKIEGIANQKYIHTIPCAGYILE
jgi:DNA-binding response OmpR family regulator